MLGNRAIATAAISSLEAGSAAALSVGFTLSVAFEARLTSLLGTILDDPAPKVYTVQLTTWPLTR